MNVACQRILDRDQACISCSRDNGIKYHVERFAWLCFHIPKIIERSLFTIRTRLALESNSHFAPLSATLITDNCLPLSPTRRKLQSSHKVLSGQSLPASLTRRHKRSGHSGS